MSNAISPLEAAVREYIREQFPVILREDAHKAVREWDKKTRNVFLDWATSTHRQDLSPFVRAWVCFVAEEILNLALLGVAHGRVRGTGYFECRLATVVWAYRSRQIAAEILPEGRQLAHPDRAGMASAHAIGTVWWGDDTAAMKDPVAAGARWLNRLKNNPSRSEFCNTLLEILTQVPVEERFFRP